MLVLTVMVVGIGVGESLFIIVRFASVGKFLLNMVLFCKKSWWVVGGWVVANSYDYLRFLNSFVPSGNSLFSLILWDNLVGLVPVKVLLCIWDKHLKPRFLYLFLQTF